MDRDRDRRYDRERERDRERLGGDAYRPRRSPPRENYSADTYTPSRRSPPPYRRRSRSPGRDFRERPRSPPPRRFSPRREPDRRYRSPPREPRYRSPPREPRYRSPRRERSPSPSYPKRPRDFTPDRPRSPPPKRERFSSPPRRPYSPRSDRRERSPRRFDEPPRRRSPEPPYGSASNSRPTSPPAHPARARLVPDQPSRPGSVRSGYESPARSPMVRRPSPPREPEADRDYQSSHTLQEESPYHNGSEPPTRPREPPTGPAAASTSPTNRFGNPILSAPSRPRGNRGGGFGGYPPRDFANRPPVRRDYSAGNHHPRGGYMGGPGPGPSPRGGHFGSGPPSAGPPSSFRAAGNGTSTTYPRSQRFDTASHLSDLATPAPGGQRLPPQDAASDAKIRRLEEEAERLRAQIDEKQRRLRGGLRDWDRLDAETRSASLRADFAEETLRKVGGDEGSGTLF